MAFEWVVRPYMRRADWPLTLSLFLSKTAVLGSAAVGSVFFSSPFLRVFGLVLRGLWVGPVLVGVNWEVWSKLFCCLASAIQHHIMREPHTIKLMSRKVSFLYALLFKGLGGIIFCCFWKCFLLSKAVFIWSVSFLFEYILILFLSTAKLKYQHYSSFQCHIILHKSLLLNNNFLWLSMLKTAVQRFLFCRNRDTFTKWFFD